MQDFGFGDVIEGKCSKCGHTMESGDYPFCPHGKAETSMIVSDGIPGGITLENYGPKPVTFYSHSERRRYMEAHGLREMERFSPTPGTDKDPAGIPNPAGYMDPYTRENARILLSRNGRKPYNDESATHGVLLDGGSKELTTEEAIAIQATTRS